jgi:uncharacterized protein (DUF849 family)
MEWTLVRKTSFMERNLHFLTTWQDMQDMQDRDSQKETKNEFGCCETGGRRRCQKMQPLKPKLSDWKGLNFSGTI